MHLEEGVRVAVLTFRSMPSAIGKNCFQPIKIIAHNIEPFIDHKPGKILAVMRRNSSYSRSPGVSPERD